MAPGVMLARSPPTPAQEARALRAEARLMTMAGVILLAIGLPLSLILTALALAGTIGALVPFWAGLPPIVLGWGACSLASRRLERAQALEGRPHEASAA